MMKPTLLAATLALLPFAALAQTAPQPTYSPAVAGPAMAQAYKQQPDPRLAGPTISALQALVALREAELGALSQDAARKLHEATVADDAHQETWAKWFDDRVKADAAKPAPEPKPVAGIPVPDAPPK